MHAVRSLKFHCKGERSDDELEILEHMHVSGDKEVRKEAKRSKWESGPTELRRVQVHQVPIYITRAVSGAAVLSLHLFHTAFLLLRELPKDLRVLKISFICRKG